MSGREKVLMLESSCWGMRSPRDVCQHKVGLSSFICHHYLPSVSWMQLILYQVIPADKGRGVVSAVDNCKAGIFQNLKLFDKLVLVPIQPGFSSFANFADHSL